MTPQDRAEKSAEALWREDWASQAMGMEIVSVGEGTAQLRMTVRRDMCNGHGICHGGMTFTLADSCFAFACNSRNQNTVAQHNMISFLAPGREGDVLTATASEVELTGRSGIYDIDVTNQDGTTIARMRGMSRAIRGHLFEEGSEE
ncbi:hydroxyphenylacetyl-CoA thioesterase PaaI [Mesobacterium pallidum]|uniref:hydroxyphenylacetyl-CoA thioesterase PaaI n=1 Tax=Mesobacterium pallidum TaxID=2872037 RepID=UPI001EE1AB7D|nr:hydroxyphenylacetyl-CoA thioesterase PaaI [Mesobacterium pallidum]